VYIYLDESGNFVPSDSTESRISCVAALVIPGRIRDKVFKDFRTIKSSWGYVETEIKGSKLKEREIDEVIRFLSDYDVIADICCIDVGMHSLDQIERFKKIQADKITESLTPEHQPSMIEELNRYKKIVLELPNQLLIQATVTIELIKQLLETATIYCSLHIPEELSSFAWVVDAKNTSITKYEEYWSTLISPFLSATTNLLKAEEGDYSHFTRFTRALDSMPPPKQVVQPPPDPRGYVDIGMVMRDINFNDSREDDGIQLADIVASAFSRAMNGTLAKEGWVNLGSIFIYRGARTIMLITLQDGVTPIPDGPPYDFNVEVIREIKKKAKTLR
jgi:hypothetical protein